MFKKIAFFFDLLNKIFMLLLSLRLLYTTIDIYIRAQSLLYTYNKLLLTLAASYLLVCPMFSPPHSLHLHLHLRLRLRLCSRLR